MSAPRLFPPDPLGSGGIVAFGRRLRGGATTAAATTEAFLARIEAFDGRLGAFEHVAAEMALASARAMDDALAAGLDLGPLMGVPVGVKDLLAVEGMPTTAGSNVDVNDIIGPEGAFVRRLKRAGCVILGKTRTVEFAFGGATHTRGTPWNPWDEKVHRSAAGSSSGSAVAVTAGMSGFAIGSDTGGSVRRTRAPFAPPSGRGETGRRRGVRSSHLPPPTGGKPAGTPRHVPLSGAFHRLATWVASTRAANARPARSVAHPASSSNRAAPPRHSRRHQLAGAIRKDRWRGA